MNNYWSNQIIIDLSDEFPSDIYYRVVAMLGHMPTTQLPTYDVFDT